MKTSKVALIVLLALAATLPAAAITVVNPGFETDVLADGTNNSSHFQSVEPSSVPANGSGVATGWTESGVASEWLGFVENPGSGYTQATEGNNVWFMQNNTITQTLSFAEIGIGDTITVSFDAWNTNNFAADSLRINFAGLGAQSASGLTRNGPVVAQSIEFTATSAITSGDLTFQSTLGGHRYRLDNISVEHTAVPEPATMSILGLGAISLLRRRRK